MDMQWAYLKRNNDIIKLPIGKDVRKYFIVKRLKEEEEKWLEAWISALLYVTEKQ